MANESSNQRGGSGNFANDPERASEAGRKGGQQSHQGSGQSDQSQQGGSGSSRDQQRGGTATLPTIRNEPVRPAARAGSNPIRARVSPTNRSKAGPGAHARGPRRSNDPPRGPHRPDRVRRNLTRRSCGADSA